ncbi:adhesion G protein-coupled receptor L1 [Galendromus occidentalis]|uniref:Adhesion G protein-coupled receptor L1 n=1 Tax=Galendromus occidentalis TaxID=34638 RepID=A0AAJ6QQS2_9ACAR|nr:adhesion G protein-coupled receptor L1 [Galendromus occidentalis]
MSFRCKAVSFASFAVLWWATVSANTKVESDHSEQVWLGADRRYFSFVDRKGALSLSYEEAAKKCAREKATIWDINSDETLRGGTKRADQTIAKEVLQELRGKTEVAAQIEGDEILKRLNLVFGKSLSSEDCKLYVAGPFTQDFYAFTYYDNCSSQDGTSTPIWFVCQAVEDSGGTTTTEPPEKKESSASPAEKETSTSSIGTTSEGSHVTPGDRVDQETIERINKSIAEEKDAGKLIDEVTNRIRDLKKPFAGLKSFQDKLLDAIQRLVDRDPQRASAATEDLFSKTVPELAGQMTHPEEYVSILRFVANVSSEIAVLTDVNTTISNVRPGIKSTVLYRVQTLKLQRDLIYDSRVRTSAVRTKYTGEFTEGTIVTTHMEFENKIVQNQMIDATYNGPEMFSSDLVEFFMRLGNGEKHVGEVNLFFDRRTKQVRRASSHECVYYNIGKGVLDDGGCVFKGVQDGKIHCFCNHTTTFGSVFLPESFDGNFDVALNVFSYILDFFSLTALFLSILIFGLVRQIRSLLTVIHLNLCLCLFVSEVIIVIHSFAYSFSEKYECSIYLGMLVHYTFLAVIAWSTLEGIYILQLMIVVFRPPESHTRFYIAVGYMVPLIFPAIAATFDRPYSSKSGQLCFLDQRKESGLYWTFLGPLMLMLTVNLVAISAVMYRLCTINRTVRTVKSELLRYLRGIICMTALLGLQWTLGFTSILFDYGFIKFFCILLFVFFTLLQGPLIFFVHIMLVKDTRYAVARYLSKRGRVSRCLANFIRPPPPAMETNLQHGNSSTKSTEVASSNHSSSAPQTPLELKFVTEHPAGRSNGVK